MTFSYQDLQEGDTRRHLSHGRCWVRRSGEWWNRRFGTLRVEWSALPAGHCGWGVSFGDGDGGRNFGVTFSLPFAFTLYVTLENAFARRMFDYDFDRGDNREVKVSIHDWGIWYSVWVGSMASWSRSYPWCRWWRQGHFDFRLLLGKQHYTRETIKAAQAIKIPMPEGIYSAEATVERATWKRPLWFKRERISVDVKIPKGIPFAGKGENSWDCGDDGLFGYGSDGPSIEKAIGKGVEIVLQNRRRYGHASPEAIRKALAVQP